MPTALHHEGIYIAKFIHWDNSTIPTQLRDETIVGVTWLIMKDKIIWDKLRKETTLLMVQNRSFHKTNNINVAQET